MKDTGPDAVPPDLSRSLGADRREVDARARAVLEDRPLFDVPVEDRAHLVLDREDETRAALLLALGAPADVEPHRRVERGLLGDEEVRQLVPESLGLGVVEEVAALSALVVVPGDDPVDHLLDGALPLRGVRGAAEVLLRGDVRGVLRPRPRDLDAPLLERDLARPVVLDDRVARVPLDLVVGMHPRRREVAPDVKTPVGSGVGRVEAHL